MILGMSFYQIASFFLMYSFLGWCVEVVYHGLTLGRIVNRGFLNGPVCPVYGFGMLGVCGMLNILPQSGAQDEPNVLVLFIGGAILATLVELIAGYLLYHFFHARWWDYSHLPLNLGGYICPLYSFFWGIGCVIVVKDVHPLVKSITAAAGSFHGSALIGWIVMAILYGIYSADVIVTVLTVIGLNKKLAELERIRASLHVVSDGISDVLGYTSIQTSKCVGEGRVQASLARAELRDHTEELKKRADTLYAEIISHPHFGTGRLLAAFPNMVHRDYKDLIADIRERINNEK